MRKQDENNLVHKIVWSKSLHQIGQTKRLKVPVRKQETFFIETVLKNDRSLSCGFSALTRHEVIKEMNTYSHQGGRKGNRYRVQPCTSGKLADPMSRCRRH